MRRCAILSASRQAGFTLVEMLLAVVVGSVVLAGAYAAYSLSAARVAELQAHSRLWEKARPSLRVIARDIRRAGYEAFDGDMDPAQGSITTPITLSDSGNACCDSLQVIYDIDTTNRYRVRYYTGMSGTPSRRFLLRDTERWDGVAWVMQLAAEPVVDEVEDFQADSLLLNGDGVPTLVEYGLVLKSREALQGTQSFTTESHDPGNYDLDISDAFLRLRFTDTVRLRNVR